MTSIESVVKEMEAEMENHFSESKTTVNEYNKGLHSGIYSYIGSLLPKLKSISPQGASEGISKIREVMNWISQCVDEDHDLEVSEIKMIWNDLSDAISLIESTPHSSEGMKTENFVSVIERRIDYFNKIHHSYEAKELTYALKSIQRLVPPIMFKTGHFEYSINQPASEGMAEALTVQAVIDWMNTWEQLKDTVIPIRFKEDFASLSTGVEDNQTKKQ